MTKQPDRIIQAAYLTGKVTAAEIEKCVQNKEGIEELIKKLKDRKQTGKLRM
jgi:hypothetical protein